MRHRGCRNCHVPIAFGVVCCDCSRMIVATVVGELLVAGILFGLRSVWR